MGTLNTGKIATFSNLLTKYGQKCRLSHLARPCAHGRAPSFGKGCWRSVGCGVQGGAETQIEEKMLHLLPKFNGFSAKLRKRCYIFCPNLTDFASNWGKDVTSFAQIRRIQPQIEQKMLHLLPKFIGFGLKLRKRCYIFCPTPAASASN